jgi:hypothetical protein
MRFNKKTDFDQHCRPGGQGLPEQAFCLIKSCGERLTKGSSFNVVCYYPF